MNGMMTDDFKMKLRALLIKHEGIEKHVYTDSLGIFTIGIGRNLEAKGVSPDEINPGLKT